MKHLSSILCLLSLSLALVAHGEEWGFSFSGTILETKDDGTKTPALYNGSSNYTANVYIRLYDESSGEDADKPLWGRQITVHTRNGAFTCELRDSSGVQLSDATYQHLQDAFAHLSGDSVSVGVTPFKDTSGGEITPRQTLVAVPTAVNAGDALGTVGDVTVDGKLTVGAARVPQADFKGSVTHGGSVTFQSPTTLRSLTLDDSATFKVSSLAVGKDVSVAEVQADVLKAADLNAEVANVGSAAFTNLTLTGSAEANALKSGNGALNVAGDASALKLNCMQLVMGGSIDFFKWGGFQYLTKSSEPSSESKYHGSEANGDWTVPIDFSGGDVFISLSFRYSGTAAYTEDCGTTISIGEQDSVSPTKVAKLSASSLPDGESVWLPFQAFLRRGQKISWSGDAKAVSIYYRPFTY